MRGIPASGATFKQYVFMGVNESITLRPVSGKPDTFRLTGEFGYPELQGDGPTMVNTGSITGAIRFFDGKADVVINDPEKPVDGTRKLNPDSMDVDRCILHFKYGGHETLSVSTQGKAISCGFGFNVVADGEYQVTSRSAR